MVLARGAGEEGLDRARQSPGGIVHAQRLDMPRQFAQLHQMLVNLPVAGIQFVEVDGVGIGNHGRSWSGNAGHFAPESGPPL
jgi:hypothetical protein